MRKFVLGTPHGDRYYIHENGNIERADGQFGPSGQWKMIGLQSVGRAARLLGLSEEVASEIVIAADHWDAYQWESGTQKRLAKALGVDER